MNLASSSNHINLRKIKAGDRRAQKLLYDSHRVYLFGVANLYTDSRQEAEDILLEGFYQIFKDIGSFSGQGALRAWMRKVVVNSALMHLRKHKKHKLSQPYAEEAILNIPEPVDFTAKQRAKSIINLVRTLPEPQRIIFSLKGIEGYSYKEISERLDINEATLRSHYLRARKRLQNILHKELE